MMGNRVKWLTATVLCTLFWVHPAFAQRTLGVTSHDGVTTSVNLDAFPRHTVVTSDHGRKATFEGVALRDDGPLLPDTGPLQLVVPHDKRPARWVRQVAKVEVRDVK